MVYKQVFPHQITHSNSSVFFRNILLPLSASRCILCDFYWQ